MKRIHSVSVAVCCGLVLLMALYGCDGGGGDDDGDNGSQTTTISQEQARSTSRVVIDRVLDILIGTDEGSTQQQTQTSQPRGIVQGGAVTRQEPVSITLPCSVGDVSFDGEVDSQDGDGGESFTIVGTLNFNNCEGINGDLTLDSSGTIGNSEIDLELTLNQSVTAEGCNITFDPFTVDTSATFSGELTSSVNANGLLNATCDGNSIACTLNNVNLEDQQAFDDSCREV